MKSKYVMICLLCFIVATHAWRDYKPQIKQQLEQSLAKSKQKQQNTSFILHSQSMALLVR